MRIRERLDYVLKHNTWIQLSFKRMASLFFRFVGLFVKRDDHLVLINSFAGKKYNDSPRILFESMRDDPRFAQLKFVWAFEHPEQFDIKGADTIKIDTWKYFVTALKAGIWISSVNIERGLFFKKKGTFYINTWHGAGTKTIGNAIPHRKFYDYSNVDLMLVQSSFEEEIFLRDFNCRPEALRKIGFPRNDELFHITDEETRKYRELFGIPDGKKVILYAPTWRDSDDGGLSYKVAPPIDMDKWRSRLSEDYVMLFRMHPFTTIFDMKYDDFARNTSSYDNLNHVLAITDVLITDYSTIIYDSAVAHIPFICFGFDYEKYREHRGFYFDLNERYPGGVLHTEDEVMERIDAVMRGVDKEKYEAFRNKYVEAGGDATAQILDELAAHLKK